MPLTFTLLSLCSAEWLRASLSETPRVCYTINFAVSPLPPVEETTLMRRNFACTPLTVRASPAVFVVVSIV